MCPLVPSMVDPGTGTIYRHGAGNVHGPRTDNTAVTSVRSHRAGRSITSRKLSVIKCVRSLGRSALIDSC